MLGSNGGSGVAPQLEAEKLLFHAFPRARRGPVLDGKAVTWLPHTEADLLRAYAILQQVIEHGVLCTPEAFAIYPDPESECLEKLAALRENSPYMTVTQSRACFTLMDRHELTRGNSLGPPHSEIFGPFSIGIDPLRARSLGICPVFYYYRHLHLEDSGKGSILDSISGLGAQVVSRLTEMATIFSILSRVEAIARPQEVWSLSQDLLNEMDIGPKFEKKIERLLGKLGRREADNILTYFDTDRVAAWNIVDFIHMLLSFYQSADSTIDGTPLAFFNQREWRLVFHTRRGLKWIGLGEHPPYKNPDADSTATRSEQLKDFLAKNTSRGLDANYLQHCWVLHQADGFFFRDFIKEIIVPPGYVEKTRKLIAQYSFAYEVPVVYEGQNS